MHWPPTDPYLDLNIVDKVRHDEDLLSSSRCNKEMFDLLQELSY